MNNEELISEVLNRPPIWMSKHPHHKYKNVIKRLWEEIKQYFPEYEVEQLKKKWKNLKDTYRKELKKNPTSGDPGTDDFISSQWKYFNMMSFLKEEFMPAENESNLNEHIINEDLDASSRSEAQSTPPLSPAAVLRPREGSSPQPCNSQSETPYSSRKRSKPNDIRAEYLEIEKKKLKILEQEVTRQNNLGENTPDTEQTGDYYYLMSLLPEMQKFTPIQKMRVRNKINKVLMDEMIMNNMYGDTYTSIG